MSTIRRVYYYAITFITLSIFASGVGILLMLGFDIAIKSSPMVKSPGFITQQLSLGLAMLIIGGPLWFLFWRAVQRQVDGIQTEIGSAIRKFFLNLILVITAMTSFYTATTFFTWLMAGMPRERFLPGGLATLIVTLAVWFYHWQVAENEGCPSGVAKTLRRWYVYIVAAQGLVQLSVGLVQLASVTIMYLPIWGGATIYGAFWSSGVQFSIAWIILGGIYWGFHWFRMAKGDSDSTLRQVYLYLLAILGSSIAGLVALTTSVYQVLIWAFGAVTKSLGLHFQFLSWSVPTMLVAIALWSYHQRVSQEEAAQVHERRLSAQRIHSYLMTAIGLGTLIAGLIILLGILLGLLINAVSRPVAGSPGWWRSQLSLSLAFLLVAAPIWLYYWGQALKRAAAGGLIEYTKKRLATRRV